MSSSFENGYNWTDEMQPQNLSRYQPDSATHEEIEPVPQDFISLFPSAFSSSPLDDNLLKRNDLNALHCQQRPVNSSVIGDQKHIDMICPELAGIDALHHSSAAAVGNGYGNYNILTHTLSHSAPETYLEDRFLGLGGAEIEGSEEPTGSFINSFETQFYPPHVSSLIYSSALHSNGPEDIYENVSTYPNEVQTTAVLDLSPTVSSVNKPASHPEGLASYTLSDSDTNKHQMKLNYVYSPLNNNESTSFKNNYSKYELANPTATNIPAPQYEAIPNSSMLLNYELEHSNFRLYQPRKMAKLNKEGFINTNAVCSEPFMEERSKGSKIYNESIPCTDSSQYFDCELPPVCSSSRTLKMSQEPIGTYTDKLIDTMVVPGKQYRLSRLSNQELAPSVDMKENSKLLMDLRSNRESTPDDVKAKKQQPVKKSERIMKAKAFAQIEKEGSLTKTVAKVQKPKKKQVVTCNECSAQFSEWHSLKIHLYLHTGERPFRCDVCGERFTKSSSLTVHQLKHTGEKPHKCSTCAKSFRLISTLKSHLLTHTGEKPFQCDVCKSMFTQRSALNRHRNIHFDIKPFTCELCGNSFKDRFYYKKHLACHELKAKHSCKVCGEGFYTNKRLQIHAMKHNEGPNPYKCNKCTAEFVNQKAWRQHKRRNHERKEELRCEDCDATFKRRESFKAHKKVHTGDNLLKCEFCEANFNNIGTLRKHVKKHENNLVSNKSVKRVAVANSDTGLKYSNPSLPTESRSLSCCKCQRTFSTRRQLKTHRCYDKFDGNVHSSFSDESRSNSETFSDNNIRKETILRDENRFDISPLSLAITDTSSGSNKGTLVGMNPDSSVLDNTDMHIDYGQVISDLSSHVGFKNSKAPNKLISDINLIFTKKCDPKTVPTSHEPNAVNLLSAVLEVTDNGFCRNEGRIS